MNGYTKRSAYQKDYVRIIKIDGPLRKVYV